MSHRGAYFVLLALVATTANAQVLFADDFESGQLLIADGGSWQSLFDDPMPWQVFTNTPAAAFRGTGGLQLDDFGDGGSDAVGNGAFIRYSLAQPVIGDLYLRYHYRLGRDAGFGGPFPIQILNNTGAVAEMSLLNSDDTLLLNCVDNQFRTCPTSKPHVLDQWHEVLLVMEGLGTATGLCRLVVDGERVCEMPMNWASTDIQRILAGAGALNCSWDGRLQMDDVILTRGAAPPSRLSLSGPSVVDAGTCTAWTIKTVSNLDGGVVPVAQPAVASFFGSSAPALFSDPQCVTAVASLALTTDAGAYSVGLVFDGAPGARELTVSASWLESATVPVTINADVTFADAGMDAGSVATDAGGDGGTGNGEAGADGGSADRATGTEYDVGCGCGTSAGVSMFLLLLVSMTIRRGPRAPMRATKSPPDF